MKREKKVIWQLNKKYKMLLMNSHDSFTVGDTENSLSVPKMVAFNTLDNGIFDLYEICAARILYLIKQFIVVHSYLNIE